ncbi:MAG: anti-sigma factor [Flavobacteriaceae bacterium]|nr:anti-sigma factor [Mangrovimonas sp.]MCB0437553.1 anti-sigma factor [Mangrovimonas sp.]HPF96545.1 anti-sigma factor [Mangrovimonas sp.]
MNEEINTFLNSNLLEKYLLGETTFAEEKKVEYYLAEYPQVKKAYNTLQDNLEIVANSHAVEAPKNLLGSILKELDDAPVISIKQRRFSSRWYRYSVAASVIAFLFAGTSYFFYKQNKDLSVENQKIADEVFDLRGDIDSQNKRLSDIMDQLQQLNDPETQKYLLTGNNRAKNLKTVAYINPKEKISMIDVVSLPPLPEDQCYQIWAKVQDKMVSLGILDKADRQLKNIPYTEDALGFEITIEPKGGNHDATVENTVASIELQ